MSRWPMVPLASFMRLRQPDVDVSPAGTYQFAGVYCFGKGLFVGERKSGLGFAYKRLTRLEDGNFVYPKLMAWEGALAVVTPEFGGLYVSPEFPVFEIAADRALPRFVELYFQRPSTWPELSGASTGTNVRRRRIHPAQFLRATIPLPPLSEQRRLVGRVDALIAKIEEAKALRQSARGDCESLVSSNISRLLNSVVTKAVQIAELAGVRGGIQKSPDRVPRSNPVRYLTVAHVHRDHVSSDDPRYFEVEPSELERWRLLAGDVLIIEGNGSADQIGRTALFRGEIDPCVHQNHVIRIRPDQRRVRPEFLNLYLNSPVGQRAVQAQSRTTSGLRSLSVGRIKSIEVRLPECSLQDKIVRIVQRLRESSLKVFELHDATERELKGIVPAILNRAFQGEL
jgi:type I restriction enzyme S subunit